MEIKKDIIVKIDTLLQMAFDDGQINFLSEPDENWKKGFRICKSLNLIRRKSSGLFELDEKGVFVIQDGGIEKYLTNIREEKFLDSQIKRLTKKRLEWEYVINFLFLITGAVLTFIFTNISESTNQKQSTEKLHNLKTEINDSISKIQTRLNEQNKSILDIKNATDSLKTEK
ncbi:hypothetical protein PK35_16805 [Tamlana nanhaiensis]|uniref:Uncharacterized protein n=1 Tax=Neotamlana nanhaiensis TaxID=1382798 RepID=A0A0D7VX78_9FLAO|nr:hypothetical protein [Tamlana nanhaiensis]KJD31048.1 hypothetical protein PK35_16805 [Tamlana nanhaiensis]